MRTIWMCPALRVGTAGQAAPPDPYAFGMLNPRSLQATAAYWNPILNAVPARSGGLLELHIGRTANEATDRVLQLATQSLGLPKAHGFVAADEHDYASCPTFFKPIRGPVNA